MNASHGRPQVAVPTIRATLSRVQWKPEGKALPGQHDEWRARATHMITTADGIPGQRKARMIAVAGLLTTLCDVAGNLQMNVPNMSPVLLRAGHLLGEKTIRRALHDLERYGYVEIVEQARIQGARKCNLYRLRPFLDAAQERFQNDPKTTPRPLLGVQVAKCGHPVQTVGRSTLDIYPTISKASSLPAWTPSPNNRAAAITFTSPAKAPTDTLRVAALRSVGMTNPETLALRWDAIPEAVFAAKISQSQSKDNPPGWLRKALDGVLTNPTPTIQPAPQRASQAALDARSAAGSLYGVAVNGQPMSRGDAITAMGRSDEEYRISENLSDEAQSLLPEAVYLLLSERGHAA